MASGARYALKVVDKHLVLRHRAVHRLKRERSILDRFTAPCVAQLYFTFQDEASVYLGLELCPNGGTWPSAESPLGQLIDPVKFNHSFLLMQP